MVGLLGFCHMRRIRENASRRPRQQTLHAEIKIQPLNTEYRLDSHVASRSLAMAYVL
jgi:hypothetical protein